MELPNVFQNKNININQKEEQEFFYSANKTKTKVIPKEIDVDKKINQLFQSSNYVYKLNVIINTEDKDIDTVIIGKVQNYLLTINNELIPINKIIDINEKRGN